MEERTTGETVTGTPPLHRPQQTEFADILKVLLAVTVICGCFFLLNLVECNDFKLLWIRVTAK